MSVPYYIGAKAIAARLGYRSPKMVMKLVERAGLPVYKRQIKHRTGSVMAFSISESAITSWEIVQGQRFVNSVKAKREAEAEQQRHARSTA